VWAYRVMQKYAQDLGAAPKNNPTFHMKTSELLMGRVAVAMS